MSNSEGTVVEVRLSPLLEAEREVVTVAEMADWPESILSAVGAVLVRTDLLDAVTHTESRHWADE